ncbi:thioredoxin [Candidatus Woesearchaeota archaeon]|nr:thioredoxin [Candidatus Woesearchaeota archaeon]
MEENNMVVELSIENFDKEIKESSVPVVVDFWAPWCGPCQMMAPVFEELSKEFNGKVKLVKLNTDENQQIAGGFQIRGIPTLIILKDGKEVDRIVGFAPKEVLKQKIESTIA